MSFTTDKNDPNLKKIKSNGQQESYVVLSEEERAKGFVRPVRSSYTHVGMDFNGRDVTVLDERDVSDGKTYVATYISAWKEDGSILGRGYLTEDQWYEYKNNEGFIGGCGGSTKMAQPLAETYARTPSFYSGTFCAICKTHVNLDQFVWDGTNEKVGS